MKTLAILSVALATTVLGRAQDAAKPPAIPGLTPPPRTATMEAGRPPAAEPTSPSLEALLEPGAESKSNPAPAATASAPVKPANESVSLSAAPQLTTQPQVLPPAQAVTAPARPTPSIRNLRATIAESRYPETVRRLGAGYESVNVPPGWKMVQIRSLQYNPAPTIPLANGEVFSVQCSPFVLIPASENMRVAINPRGLQVIHNFYLAQEEIMRQLEEAMKATNVVTQID